MQRTYRDELAKIYTGDRTKRDSMYPTGPRNLMNLALAEALEDHAEALTRAAAASDKSADQLVRVTGRLGIATWALVLVAVVQIIVTWWRG